MLSFFIVLSVILASYIWFTETHYPIVGKNAELMNNYSKIKYANDSLLKVLGEPHIYYVSLMVADSVVCKTCQGVEEINGKYYQQLAKFYTKPDADYSASQLLKLGISNVKIIDNNSVYEVK